MNHLRLSIRIPRFALLSITWSWRLRIPARVHFHDLPSVEGHEIAVVQLFQNLVGNAIKYAGPNPPEITISAEPADEGLRWLFSVQDNGIGIDAEHHKRIFGIFKRLTGNDSPGNVSVWRSAPRLSNGMADASGWNHSRASARRSSSTFPR